MQIILRQISFAIALGTVALACAALAAPAPLTQPPLAADDPGEFTRATNTAPVGQASIQASNAAATTCFQSLALSPATAQPCTDALAQAHLPVIEAQLHSALALQHARGQQIQAAQESINRALALAPEDSVVQGNLGNIYLLNSNFRDAVTAYNNALQEQTTRTDNTHNAVVYLNRSLALRGLGRYQEAQLDYAAYLAALNAPPQRSRLPGQEVIGVDKFTPRAQPR